MAGGGSKSGAANDQAFTWNGASAGSKGDPFFGFGNTQFDAKDFGAKLGHDLNASYMQGPGELPTSLYAGIGPETTSLVNNGLTALNPVASGGWLSGGNPFFEQNLQKTLQNTKDTVNQGFNTSGRFGGSPYVETMTDQLSNTELGARNANFENEWQRMLQSQQAGLGLSGMLDQNAQNSLDAQNQMFDLQNNQNLNHTLKFQNALTAGSDTSAYSQQANPWANLLSTGLAVAGLFSDERLKKDIAEVGKTKDGQNVYSWVYKGDPTETTHMGLLAQEVQEKTPEAVNMHPSGFLKVDYKKALGKGK